MPYCDNDLNQLIVPTGIIKRFDVLAFGNKFGASLSPYFLQ